MFINAAAARKRWVPVPLPATINEAREIGSPQHFILDHLSLISL